jgi:hypothetical protein
MRWRPVACTSAQNTSQSVIKYCGKTLVRVAFNPGVYDVTAKSVNIKVGADIAYVMLQVASSCDVGAAVSVPPNEGRITAKVDAKNGQPVAVAVDIVSSPATVSVADGARTATITFGHCPPSAGPSPC